MESITGLRHRFVEDTAPDNQKAMVYVVEDDDTMRGSLIEAIRIGGHECRGFASAEDFMAQGKLKRPSCLLLDYRLPGINGLELQAKLVEACVGKDSLIPIIVVTGHADVPSAVRFMERGAVTLLEKPFHTGQLMDAIDSAIDLDQVRLRVQRRFARNAEAFEQLSPRERTVLQAIADGQLNKAIAKALNVSVRTVEGDRARIVEKFSAETAGEVVGKFAQLSLLTELGYRLDGPQPMNRPAAASLRSPRQDAGTDAKTRA